MDNLSEIDELLKELSDEQSQLSQEIDELISAIHQDLLNLAQTFESQTTSAQQGL